MDLDLEKNFSKYEDKITDKLVSEKWRYRNSSCNKRYLERVKRLDDSNDMIYGTSGYFTSKLGFPIQKVRSMTRNAVFDQNWRASPLLSIQNTANTTKEKAENVEELLNDNVRKTKFREKDFKLIKKNVSEHGAAVVYSHPIENSKEYLRTQQTEIGFERVRTRNQDILVQNQCIDETKYFQDPDIADPEMSPYQGHEDSISFAHLIKMYDANPENYIKKNIIKLLDKAKEKGTLDLDKLGHDLDNNHITITYHYSTCNITGNEGNENRYYFELVDDTIIRVVKDLYDEDLVPYTVFTFMTRNDVWWGGTDGELVLPHENIINVFNNTKMELALKAQDQFTIFDERLEIDPYDWEKRHVKGAVFAKPSEGNIKDMIFTPEFNDRSLMAVDSVQKDIYANIQTLTTNPDFNNPATKADAGKYTTAKAIEAMSQPGDIMEGSFSSNFNHCLISMFRKNLIIYTQILPEEFMVEAQGNELLLGKSDIMGKFDMIIQTSLTRNKVSEMLRMSSVINEIMNYRGTMDPAFLAIQLPEIVRQWLKKADIGDIDTIYNINAATQQQAQPQPAQGQEAQLEMAA